VSKSPPTAGRHLPSSNNCREEARSRGLWNLFLSGPHGAGLTNLVLPVLKTAWLMDTVGNQRSRVEISAIKIAAPNVALRVIDRAIQMLGGAGVSSDVPPAAMWARARTLRIADGPDEGHRRSVARQERRRYRATTGRCVQRYRPS
jgi:alkylation response protein AidB-like acyl-CoA dehydrogenase